MRLGQFALVGIASVLAVVLGDLRRSFSTGKTLNERIGNYALVDARWEIEGLNPVYRFFFRTHLQELPRRLGRRACMLVNRF
jgi:hypothetical protein